MKTFPFTAVTRIVGGLGVEDIVAVEIGEGVDVWGKLLICPTVADEGVFVEAVSEAVLLGKAEFAWAAFEVTLQALRMSVKATRSVRGFILFIPFLFTSLLCPRNPAEVRRGCESGVVPSV